MLIVLALAVAGGAFWLWWPHWQPAREAYPLQGVSVSSVQGDIDWRQARGEGVDFAYVRAGGGTAGRDPAFARNIRALKNEGIRYGAELIYDPCLTADEQTTIFLTTVPRDNAALPPVVHLTDYHGCSGGGEPGRDHILSELNTVINVVETHSGKPAIVRIPAELEGKYHVGDAINRTLWLERNYLPPDYTERGWVMWTANDDRRIAGIEGPVEWSVVAP